MLVPWRMQECRASSCLSSIKVTSDGMDSLVALSQGDMRRALNILQVRKVRVLQTSDEAEHSGRHFIHQCFM